MANFLLKNGQNSRFNLPKEAFHCIYGNPRSSAFQISTLPLILTNIIDIFYI